MNLERILAKKRIIICCGSGGVGKTTMAAAIALEAAVQGKKAIVLTIDPAKRLATAMGLGTLGNVPKKIHIPKISGELFAMMLDTKRTFDRLIEKYTSDPEKRKTIFENHLYQHVSNMIAGSQEYMAMEKLYELFHEGNYEVMVLDTPPTRHALDFLDAPKKMVHLTGNSLLKWFLKPGLFAGSLGLGTLNKGVRKIFSVFDRLAGLSFLSELSEMLSLISNLFGGFHERAQAVYDLLRENFVGFLLVTGPTSVSVQDALYFHRRIINEELPFLGFIINRVHPKLGPEFELEGLSEPLRNKILVYLKDYGFLVERDKKAIALLKKAGEKKTHYATIPIFAHDVHDLEGLKKIAQKLFS